MASARQNAMKAMQKLEKELTGGGPLEFPEGERRADAIMAWLWGFHASCGGQWHAFIKAVEVVADIDDYAGQEYAFWVQTALRLYSEPDISAPSGRR